MRVQQNQKIKNRRRFVIGILVFLSMLAIPAYADDFSKTYGTYKIEHNNQIGVAFIYQTYKYQNDNTKSYIMLRKEPLHAVSGHVIYSNNGNLYVEQKEKNGFDIISFCPNANFKKGNNKFSCKGTLFTSENNTNFKLEKLEGKEEVSFLTQWFDAIPADDYVGEHKIPSTSMDMGFSDTKVEFTKSDTHFLDVKINSEFSSFEGVAKPIGNNILLISYKDYMDNIHAVECLTTTKKKRVSHMFCQGTLQGIKIKSEHSSFTLKR